MPPIHPPPDPDPSQPTTGARVVRSFAWQAGAVAVGQAVSWVATIVVIRLLSPSDFGLMAMVHLWMGFLLLASDLGIAAAAIQQQRLLTSDQLRVLFGLVLLTTGASAALTWGAAPVVAGFFGQPRVTALLRTTSAAFFFLSLYLLPQALLIRDLGFDRKARVEVLAATASALVSVTLALSGFGVWALVGGVLALHGVNAVAYQLIRPCLPRPSFALRSGLEILRFGGLTALSRILFWASGSVDVAIAGRVLGERLLGVYSVALSMALMPLNKLMPILTQVSFAAFSRIQDDRERVRRNVHRALQVVGMVVFPTFVGLAVVAPEAIPLILGKKWSEAVVPCQLLCAVFPLRPLTGVLAPALFGIGRPEVNVMNRALTLGVLGVAFLVGVQWGLIGLCISWIVAYPPVVLVTSLLALKALEIPAREAAGDVAFFAFASGVMGAVLAVVRMVLGPTLSAPWLLACLVAAGLLLYAGILLLYKPRLLLEFRSIVRGVA